ncbi:MAG: alpha/beta fold hydrolase [Spirochaetia bacterium]|nr:alpha/beta fold hydrolase [Spirochaetia bacterium]
MKFNLKYARISNWNGNNVFISHFYNSMSLMFPEGEKFFIDGVNNYKGNIKDIEHLKQINNFIKQEAWHTRVHASYNSLLEKKGHNLEDLEQFVKTAVRGFNQKHPLMRLALVVAFEHFTAILADVLLKHRDKLLVNSDPEFSKLWLWHAAEELEHKSVAYDLYLEVGGGYFRRVYAMLRATYQFFYNSISSLRLILKNDHEKMNPGDFTNGLKYLFIYPALITRIIPAYLVFFLPGFHPWRNQNHYLVKDWEKMNLKSTETDRIENSARKNGKKQSKQSHLDQNIPAYNGIRKVLDYIKNSTIKKSTLYLTIIFSLLLSFFLFPVIYKKDTISYEQAILNAEGRIVKINNRRVHFIEKGHGPAIIMIHGYLYNTVMWDSQIEYFSKNHRVIAVDLFGMGYSERLPHNEYSIKVYSDQIISLMDSLQIRKAVFFGQSMGGGISVYIAAHHRERVSKLVLSSPMILPYSENMTSRIYETPFVGEFLNALPGEGFLIRNIKKTWYYDRAKPGDIKLTKILKPLMIENTFDGLLFILRNIIKYPMLKREAEIISKAPLPVLIVHGEFDNAIPPEKSVLFIQMMKELGQLIIFEKAAHSPHEEYPDRFNKIAEKFIIEPSVKFH